MKKGRKFLLISGLVLVWTGVAGGLFYMLVPFRIDEDLASAVGVIGIALFSLGFYVLKLGLEFDSSKDSFERNQTQLEMLVSTADTPTWLTSKVVAGSQKPDLTNRQEMLVNDS